MIIAVNKRRIYEFFFYVSMNVYMLMCFKSIWHDPRPYMVNTRIKPLEGYAEYGNPSGHVYMGYILISYGMEQYVYHHKLWINCEQCATHKNNRNWMRVVHFLLVFGVIISRMYLGMHSFNQCLLSLALGIFFHLLWNAYFSERLKKHLENLTAKGNTKRKIGEFIIAVVFNIIGIGLTYYLWNLDMTALYDQ